MGGLPASAFTKSEDFMISVPPAATLTAPILSNQLTDSAPTLVPVQVIVPVPNISTWIPDEFALLRWLLTIQFPVPEKTNGCDTAPPMRYRVDSLTTHVTLELLVKPKTWPFRVDRKSTRLNSS